MTAPDSILQLVQRFDRNRDSYRSGKYNEAQLRQEFLNPFFEALGWDVFNNQGYAEAYKEVIHEASLEVEGATKAPDYAFRIGGTRKFFVEAKKPAVNIEYDIYPAFQLRRYAWSAKLPLSILTDFEEFAVYESRTKPDKSDSAATGRVMLLNYKDYPSRWDELAAIFSREAVLKGSFDQFAEGLKGKRGTTEVDDAFLAEIEGWRDLLAHHIARHNPDLQVRELNYAVQMTIDRIVFLRICEDRGIERNGQLQDLLEGEGVYARLCQLFRQADSRYNSGLFHFSEEKERFTPQDDLTLRLAIDDKVLKEIISYLYYPAPYVFREIPADILGQVYERFLGKVIRLTAGHQAKVEEKPEVRKAGGVYYTPTYIVDYIVKNTVGALLEGKTPKEAAPLKILDPACGSGSFLLGAYQYLLDWHTKWYSEHGPETWAKAKTPVIYQAQGGDWKLTTAEKKRILLANIHGVDIDPQAVEVTKLSLSLKVLEGESQETIGAQLGLFKERALPDLGRNIQCGNSLIGPDYYEDRQLTMNFMDDEERYRVNAFNWQAAFPQIFDPHPPVAASPKSDEPQSDLGEVGRGFDAVIGNPPYGAELSGNIGYFLARYPAAKKFPDSYCLFIIKAANLLKQDGKLGLIVPNTFCDLENCDDFRLWFLNKNKLSDLYQTGWAFKEAIVDTLVFVLAKGDSKKTDTVSVTIDEVKYERTIGDFLNNPLNKIDYRNNQDTLLLLNKIKTLPTLSNFVIVKAGVKLYEKGKGIPPQTEKTLKERPFTLKGKKFEGWFPLFRGEDINRYFIHPEKEFVSYGPWLAAPRSQDLFESPKILMRRTDDKLKACLEFGGSICVNSCHVIKLHDTGLGEMSYEYLLGILNSKLLQRIFEIQNPQMVGKVFSEIKVIYVERLPIRTINFSDPAEKAAHDRIVSMVERMLSLHKQTPRTPQEKEILQRDIQSIDHAIDTLVYQLYGLTPAEINIVEGKVAV